MPWHNWRSRSGRSRSPERRALHEPEEASRHKEQDTGSESESQRLRKLQDGSGKSRHADQGLSNDGAETVSNQHRSDDVTTASNISKVTPKPEDVKNGVHDAQSLAETPLERQDTETNSIPREYMGEGLGGQQVNDHDVDGEDSDGEGSHASFDPDPTNPDNYREDSDDDNNDDTGDGGEAAEGTSIASRGARALEREEALEQEEDAALEQMAKGTAIEQREAFVHLLLRGASSGKHLSPTHRPGETFFSLMFQLVSPLGLLGNLASITSLCDPWRMTNNDDTVKDAWWVLFLNALALTCGCLANVILFLHSEHFMRRFVSLVAVCVLYSAALLLYMALLGSTQDVYFKHDLATRMHRTAGYWQAVCASTLYFLSTLMVVMNLIYYRNRPWNGVQSKRQRRIMALCLLYIAWIAIGGASFQTRTMIDISYSDAVYFCIVSTLTLGYGDTVPKKTLPKALAIPYIYIGLVLGGLTTLSIFSASLASARNESVATKIEARRRQALKRSFESEEQSYEVMRHIVRSSQRRALLSRAVLTLSWLLIFWLIGALIFKYTESWDYFDAFYYVAVSLATVGYGDFTPSSPGGRSFFMYWGMLAVPTMTTAVSDLSALAMDSIRSVRMMEENWGFFGMVKAYRWYKNQRELRSGKGEQEDSSSLADRLNKLSSVLSDKERWHQISRLISVPEDTKFTHRTWKMAMCHVLGVETLNSDFWVSELSPIRDPSVNERQFLLFGALNLLRLSIPETTIERSGKGSNGKSASIGNSASTESSSFTSTTAQANVAPGGGSTA